MTDLEVSQINDFNCFWRRGEAFVITCSGQFEHLPAISRNRFKVIVPSTWHSYMILPYETRVPANSCRLQSYSSLGEKRCLLLASRIQCDNAFRRFIHAFWIGNREREMFQ